MKRKQSYDEEGKRLQPQLAKFSKDQLRRLIENKKKEVEATLKALDQANKKSPEVDYSLLVTGELKAEMDEVIKVKQAAELKEKQLKENSNKYLADAKAVYKGSGSLGSVVKLVKATPSSSR